MAQAIRAAISQRGNTYYLDESSSSLELLEGPALITISAPSRAHVFLNDENLQAIWNPSQSIAVSQLDLTNEVGYHRLRIVVDGRQDTFDFCTSSAKSTWDEIRKMAEICGSHYLGYRKQFTYFDRSGNPRKVLLPQIHYAWLRDRLPEISTIISDINRRPATQSHHRVKTSRQAKRVSVPASIRFLHENPRFLEKRNDGPISIDGTSYWPSLVKVKAKEVRLADVDHEQIAAFLRIILQGIDVLSLEVDAKERLLLSEWKAGVKAHCETPVLKEFTHARFRGTSYPPTTIQRMDSRYKRLRDIASEYFSDISSADPKRDSLRGNLKDIWEIYQTFVAHVVGHAYSLDYSSSRMDLRQRDNFGASMAVGGVRMYFDHRPPAEQLHSWRDKSRRPANERPDIFLINHLQRQALLLDAKFRVERGGVRGKAEDLFEIQGYLNGFKIGAGGIVYPGIEPVSHCISGEGQLIGEVPLRASFFEQLGGPEGVHQYMREALKPLWAAF